MLNAENRTFRIQDTEIDYIVFGSGSKNLIMIPGVGEGLKLLKGTALPFSLMYHAFAKDYRVYVFGRRRKLPQGFTTRDMADDLYKAIKQLQIQNPHVLGVSMGGMVAQWLAIDHPDLVDKLILTVTLAKKNETLQKVAENWIQMAERSDYRGIMLDTAEKSYSDNYLKKSRWMYGLISRVGKPKSFERFLVQINACLTHDTFAHLPEINCPVFVIGGRQDKIVSGKASEEIAEQIPGCSLLMYEEYGHGAYEEAKDFLTQVKDFLNKKS